MKYLQITKYDQNILETIKHTGNYKTFLREITESLCRWREILCSWIGKLNVISFAQIDL